MRYGLVDTIETKVWGVHTKNEQLLLRENVVAIGWGEMGNLGEVERTREAFKGRYMEVFSDKSTQAAATNAGQMYRFVEEMKPGDYVVFFSRSDRMVNIGVVAGEYEYKPEQTDYPNQRKVVWEKHVPRSAFSQGAMYELGAAMTLFALKNYAEEFVSAIKKGFKPFTTETEENENVLVYTEAIEDNTKDFIVKELSKKLKGYPLENFIAALLEAMGYRTEVSPQGGDSGIDITAYKDELPPRILVQVKSNDGMIREATIQSLKGAMREGDYGLFVTLSDFTKNAKKYLEATPIIRGINGVQLAELVMRYYDDLDDKYKRFVPLKRVYIPDIEE